MKIIFRVDASNRMGTGHLMRCITLAEALRERGAEMRFICRAHQGNLIEFLQKQTIPVTVLPVPEQSIMEMSAEDYAACLSVSQDEDAEQTIEILHDDRPDWLIVDHYGLDIDWEQKLRPHVERIMVIDDLANRRHDSNLLLDQNFTGESGNRYQGLLPENCRVLLGPSYALLRPEYAKYRQMLRSSDSELRRVLVFFGGSDRHNMTALALEALSAHEFSHLEVNVVIGANNLNRVFLEQQASSRPLTNLYGRQPHLADLMMQADISIGGGGTTIWERMCLGLPSIVVSTAENQRPSSEALAEAQLIHYAGHFSDVKKEDLTQHILQLCRAPDGLAEMSAKIQLQVDGLGALKIREAIYTKAISEIRLRPAVKEDVVLYYKWANDPEVRKNAVNTLPISWENHNAWFFKKMHDPNCRLFVLEEAGRSVGQIRFETEAEEAVIDYSVDTIARGRGLGSLLVEQGADLMQRIEPIRLRALVKTGNGASISIFVRNGFTEQASALEGYRSFYRDPISRAADQMNSIESGKPLMNLPKTRTVKGELF